MLNSPCYCHFAELAFNALNDVGNNGCVNMGDFVIVHVPHNGTLRSFDLGVCNALIVWVQFETHLLQGR